MWKIKHERTADCVLAGYRVHKSGPDAVGSLLLGLFDERGVLASVGVCGAFPMARRKELMVELQPLVTDVEGHPWDWAAHAGGERTPRRNEGSRWNGGKDLSFVPLRPERVLEVQVRLHGGRPVPARGAVRPLAARPRPGELHVRPARAPGHLRPRRGARHAGDMIGPVTGNERSGRRPGWRALAGVLGVAGRCTSWPRRRTTS